MEGTGRRCAVVGDPVEHSLSPVLHRAGYAAVGLDWEYEARRVAAGSLRDLLAGLDGSWRGLSVTAPLKREARERADRVTPYAGLTGAVNTLVLEDGGARVEGHNTDLPGALAALRERSDAPVQRVLLLGGGATAASVGLALCELGATELSVAVRDPERAREAVDTLARHDSGPRVRVLTLSQLAESGERPDVVVSTVPAAAQTPELVDALRDAPVVFDVVYDPWPTPLASAALGTVVSGLDLLVHQAALQFELFTGVPVPVQVLRDAGEAELARRGGR